MEHTNNDIVATLIEDDIKDVDPQEEVEKKASTTIATTTTATVLKEMSATEKELLTKAKKVKKIKRMKISEVKEESLIPNKHASK